MLSVFDFITKHQLELILKLAPIPTWDNMPHVYHYPVSPSSYHTCPGFVSFLDALGTFKADRGTRFHAHYGPYIMDAIDVGESQAETRCKLPIACDKCKKGVFDFGGYSDDIVRSYEWLLDFKFSEQPLSNMKDYDPAVSAYYWMLNKGQIEVEKDGKKRWVDTDFKISNITILKINPITFECEERAVEPLSFDEVVKQAKKKHDAKEHDIIYYEPGLKCQWCNSADKKNKTCKKSGLSIATFLPEKKEKDEE